MNKKLGKLLVFGMLSALIFTSCPQIELMIPVENKAIQENVTASLVAIKALYNKESSNDNVTPPDNFYIEIGDVSEDPLKIKVGETVFTATDRIKLSIGNDSFINDFIYKVNGGKLLIASPVLQMELSREYPDIRVDDKKAFRTDFNAGFPEMKAEGVYWDDNTSLGTPSLSEDKNQVTIEIPANNVTNAGLTILGIDFRYKSGDESLSPTFYLTKKNVEETDGVKTYTYGSTSYNTITIAGTTETKDVLAYFPYGWVEDDSDFNNGVKPNQDYAKTIDYKAKGLIEVDNSIKVVAVGKIVINLSKAE